MSDKKKVLFISYVDENMLSSGSGVRPAKMLHAFQEEGHSIISLTGSQADRTGRLRRINEVLAEIKNNKPDLCYIESPTYPIMLHADRKLIKTIHKMGIPIGYFYRDFYRKFPEEFPRRKGFSGRIKDLGLDYLQLLTDRSLFSCDVVYVPSHEACALLPYRNMRPLPPAGIDMLHEKKKCGHTGIYVGGIIGHYDGKLLLETFALLYEKSKEYRLLLVCREAEWKKIDSQYKDAPWLTVRHCSGAELDELLRKADFALVAGDKTWRYNDIAISVKVFEYLSYGLPQVAVNNKAVEELIETEKIGLTVEQNAEEMADAIERLVNDEALYEDLQKNITQSLRKRNLWVHRVRQVVADLLSKDEEKL